MQAGWWAADQKKKAENIFEAAQVRHKLTRCRASVRLLRFQRSSSP